MDLIHEIDQLLTEAQRHSDDLNDRRDHGRVDGLEEARELAMAYIKHRQAADEEAARTINDLRADLDHAERDNRRLTAVIKRIRDLHRPESDQYHGKCIECAEWWPCPTIRDLEQ